MDCQDSKKQSGGGGGRLDCGHFGTLALLSSTQMLTKGKEVKNKTFSLCVLLQSCSVFRKRSGRHSKQKQIPVWLSCSSWSSSIWLRSLEREVALLKMILHSSANNRGSAHHPLLNQTGVPYWLKTRNHTPVLSWNADQRDWRELRPWFPTP